MGSIRTNDVSVVHANHFDSQGRVVDVLTSLNQNRGVFQEDHNQANQAAENPPHYPNTNQDVMGAESKGPSTQED